MLHPTRNARKSSIVAIERTVTADASEDGPQDAMFCRFKKDHYRRQTDHLQQPYEPMEANVPNDGLWLS